MGSHQLGARSAIRSCCSVQGPYATTSCVPPTKRVPVLRGRPRQRHKGQCALGGLTRTELQRFEAHRIAMLPMKLGGLGRSASRMCHSTCWASWADSLQTISQRFPVVASQVLAHLTDNRAIGRVAGGDRQADHEGFVSRPEWTALRDGSRHPQADTSEPGEWQHGWQYHASSSSERNFQKSVVIAQSSAGDQAHLMWPCGTSASAVLLGCPTKCEFPTRPETFRLLTLERLRLPIHVAGAQCAYGAPLDQLGRHRGAWPRSELLKSRAMPPERTLARVCRETGAIVRSTVKTEGQKRCPSQG